MRTGQARSVRNTAPTTQPSSAPVVLPISSSTSRRGTGTARCPSWRSSCVVSMSSEQTNPSSRPALPQQSREDPEWDEQCHVEHRAFKCGMVTACAIDSPRSRSSLHVGDPLERHQPDGLDRRAAAGPGKRKEHGCRHETGVDRRRGRRAGPSDQRFRHGWTLWLSVVAPDRPKAVRLGHLATTGFTCRLSVVHTTRAGRLRSVSVPGTRNRLAYPGSRHVTLIEYSP